MRYRFYREHKFVIPFINDVTRLIARTDFQDEEQLKVVRERVNNVIGMLQGHAEHEEKAFHLLLEAKGSTVHQSIMKDHADHARLFDHIEASLKDISTAGTGEEKIRLGYAFYLQFREFEANNMNHINDEERVIMPELQRLYTDEELRAVEAKIYHKMEPDHMIHMMKVIFPYMDSVDHLVFLSDIQIATPDKFKNAICGILKATNDVGEPIIIAAEVKQIVAHFRITTEDLRSSGSIENMHYSFEVGKKGDMVKTTYDLEREAAKEKRQGSGDSEDSKGRVSDNVSSSSNAAG